MISILFIALMVFPLSNSWAGQKWCTQTETFPVPGNIESADHTDQNPIKLDVIWVIDDSSSMKQHQINLKDNIRHFFSVLDGEQSVDYRMGIVTTGLRTIMNEENGQPIRLLSDSAQSDRKDFMKKLLVGTDGNPDEKGTEAILRFTRLQQDFVRKGSHVLINILTDEDDETHSGEAHSVKDLLHQLQKEGNRVTVNLIAIGTTVKRYRHNLHEFNPHFYHLLSDDFSRDMSKLAAKSIGRTILDFELIVDFKKIVSIRHQTQSGDLPVSYSRMTKGHVVSVDFGIINSISASKVEITYLYACSAINRQETQKLIKRIAEIDFVPNQDVFLDPASAGATLLDVYEFLRKHDDTHINLIGAVSYPGNPLVWAKMMIKDPKDLPSAYRVAKSRSKKIETELIAMGISPDRIRSKGAFPGMHRHWYSYLLDLTFYDLVSELCVACDIESDRRVIMKIRQK